MAEKLSRRKLAKYFAGRIANGDTVRDVTEQLAAYLTETHREREADLLVRTIEDELAQLGIVVATVASARPLSSEMKQSIEALIDANELYLDTVVDEELIGGVRVETPDSVLDNTVKRKLTALRAMEMN